MTTKGSRPALGVIGLGEIGSGVANGLVRAGNELVVYDINPAAMEAFAQRAHLARTPAELGERADVAFVAVVNEDQVRDVVCGRDGILARARTGSAVVVLSTVAVDCVREVAEQAARRHVDLADCGVSGGPAAAAQGALVAMVGGQKDVVERLRPVLDSFCSLVVHTGPVGTGIAAKLARNLVQYGSWLAAYEGQRLAEAAGIELAKLAQVIRESDKRIGGVSTLMFRDSVAPWADDADENMVRAMAQAAALAHKDLAAASSLAKSLGLTLPVAEMAERRCDAIFGVGSDPATGSAELDSDGAARERVVLGGRVRDEGRVGDGGG